MKAIALTGSIGSGKSTVSDELGARGAVIIDGDLVSRELQQPGEPVFIAMVDLFGPGIVADDGTLDRQAVADIVFPDPEQLARLTAITEPAIKTAIIDRINSYDGTDHVVVVDAAIITTRHQYGEQATIVVDTPVDIAVARVVAQRGMNEDDVRARMARQISRDERVAIADFVIDNSGTAADLGRRIGEAWDWIQSLPPR
jgi:dephospho-CoA kinase